VRVIEIITLKTQSLKPFVFTKVTIFQMSEFEEFMEELNSLSFKVGLREVILNQEREQFYSFLFDLFYYIRFSSLRKIFRLSNQNLMFSIFQISEPDPLS
jgi:hypothetical protein